MFRIEIPHPSHTSSTKLTDLVVPAAHSPSCLGVAQPKTDDQQLLKQQQQQQLTTTASIWNDILQAFACLQIHTRNLCNWQTLSFLYLSYGTGKCNNTSIFHIVQKKYISW